MAEFMRKSDRVLAFCICLFIGAGAQFGEDRFTHMVGGATIGLGFVLLVFPPKDNVLPFRRRH